VVGIGTSDRSRIAIVRGVPSFLTIAWILGQFGDTLSCATTAYRRFVQQGKRVKVWEHLQ